MHKLRKINTEHYQEHFVMNAAVGRSPLRRQPQQNNNMHKSPLRSRTPNKRPSPLKHHEPLPSHIRYVSGKSPIKSKNNQINYENQMLVSNGKNIKYVNFYQSNKKDKILQEYSKGQENNQISQRRMLEDNKLFGKMVSKLNSEKKSNPSNQASYKTSVFAEQSQQKISKYNTSGKKGQNKPFRQIINQVKTEETKSQIKQRFESGKKTSEEPDQQTLSCLVYRMNNQPSERQFTEPENNKKDAMPEVMLIKRKSSKRQAVKPEIASDSKQILESNYEDFDILMTKLNEAQKGKAYIPEEDLVKMSMRVQESLSMDPYM